MQPRTGITRTGYFFIVFWNLSTIALRFKMLQPKLKVAVGDISRILLVFSVILIIHANPALSQLGELKL